MAKQDGVRTGSWLVAEEMYERGDTTFVDELRLVSDADRLGGFAGRWYADRRAAARQMLLEYLAQPFNAFRHEALLKRLFKLAEKAGDDEVMARFAAGFDRSIRRVKKKQHHYDWSTRQHWTTEKIAMPFGTAMPRDRKAMRYRNPQTGELMFAPPKKQQAIRLFSVRTRKYLRLRCWRYLRALGRTQPDRYVTAAVQVLKQYRDEDANSGLALIDNWSLVHILFHHSPVLTASASGWKLSEGRSLGELTAAPAFEPLWRQALNPLMDLLLHAGCRPVRQWALQLLRRDHATSFSRLPLRTLVSLLSHEDEDLAIFGAEALAQSPELNRISAEEWLNLIEVAGSQTLGVLAELMEKHVSPASLSLAQIAGLTCCRSFPVARLGFAWLKSARIASADDVAAALRCGNAEAETLRPEIIRWLRGSVGSSSHFQPGQLLELLDSRHPDVRHEAWEWMLGEAAVRENPELWQKLLESPYDDVRLKLVQLLEQRSAAGSAMLAQNARRNPELTRSLWASVLLNVHRGGRRKPAVVNQVVARLQQHPEEAAELIPILSVALRSVRGPEWRSGLTAVVQIAETHPEFGPQISQHFPELRLGILS